MARIINQTHSKETFLYSLSRMLEKASFYGLRSLIVLYMVGESLKMETSEAISIYGWFIGSLTFSNIIGAMLGDLVIGNKKTIVIGGILQAIGAFSLCVPSINGLYIGLFLVILGSGFYTPNVISTFGKLYLNKNKLLDSAFTILHLAVNFGSFFGVFLIAFLGEKYGWKVGFIIAGILMIFSIIPVLISKEKKLNETLKNELPLGERVLTISIVLILIGLFWAFYEISNFRSFDLQTKFRELFKLNVLKSMWSSIGSILLFPIGVFAIILWSYLYSSQIFKLTIGFVFGVISLGLLFLIPQIPNEQHAILYLSSLFFLAISETHIGPIIYSILTKHSNPKYLAILISLAFVPTRLFSGIVGFFNDELYESPTLGLKTGIIAMTIISVGLIIVMLWKRETKRNLHTSL